MKPQEGSALSSLFYDDLEVGRVYRTPARTVTETDLVTFTMLSGDWNPIHSDEEFAKSGFYGKRVVQGLFGLSMLTGLMDRAGWFHESAIAMLGIDGWRFEGPIFVGDTLRGEMEIVDKRLTSKGDRGIVNRRFSLLNQDDQLVQQGTIGVMVRLAPAGREVSA